jgi:tetratricopeptide (TPR) repeat protein
MWWPACARGPEPPAIADLPAMDPDAAAFIRERIEQVEAAPSSAAAWGALGVACEANGITSHATRAYETATRIAPEHPRWWYRLALTRSRLGDYPGALAALDRALTLDNTYAPAHWRRGLWLFDQGQMPVAEAAFRRAIEIDAADSGGWVGLARVHLARGDNQAAVESLERLLDAHPGDRYALQLLGTAYRRLGRDDDARFALALGASGEPRWRDPWSDEVAAARRGYAASLKEATEHAMAGRFGEAIPLLERLRSQKPDDLALVTYLASAYAGSGRLSDAIPLLESVLSREPDNFDARLNLGTAYVFARAFDRARPHIDRAIALRPQSAKAQATRGMMLWQTGDTAEATPVLTRAVTLDPRDPTPRVWLGLMFLERGQSASALQSFEDALQIDPMLVDALAGSGVAHLRLGAPEPARLVLDRAAQIAPDHARVIAAQNMLQQYQASVRHGQGPRR